MAASVPEPRKPAGEPRRKRRFSDHKTFLGKVGHAGFHFSKHTLQLLGILLGLILLIIVASLFVDEPMRRAMERSMNEHLTGYDARIGSLDFHLIGFSVTLHDVSIRQEAHPEPAVAVIPRLRASVQWSELLKLKLVSDFQVDQPKVYLNLVQIQQENNDDVPVQKRGWQQALEDIYPLKINLFQINDGALTYIDTDPKRPLQLTHVFVQANNIRNIRYAERVYPSPVHAEGIVFGTGRGEIDGHANFLAQPYAGVNTIFTLEKVPLDYFRPMLSRAHLSIQDGFLSSHGRVEYAPTIKVAHVEDLLIDRVRLDYVHSVANGPAEGKVQKAVRKASNEPGLLLRLDQFRLTNSNVGWVNRIKSPNYRVFVSGANLNVTNLSNQLKDGPARATLNGKFMGSGTTNARANYRADKSGLDFDLDLKIDGTQMTAMNDIWKAYGKFDVAGGSMSLYSQLRAKNGRIDGYVKPLFQNVDVYDPKQDKNKPFFKKVYEKVVEGVAGLLENKKTDKVVTVADISGPISNPHSSPMQVIGKLIENAFVKAILPGFQRELGFLRKKK
ncbi:MAG: DUF748 domain-containing protein [Acidobacteriota bacterium]